MKFKFSKLSVFLAAIGLCSAVPLARAKTFDVAYGFRMGAGFPGDVNRTNPFSVTPNLINTTTPPRLYGDPVVVDTATNSVRGMVAGDTAVTRIKGIAVRPFPVQQQTGGMSAAIGAAAPPVSGVMDVLEGGFAIVKVNSGASSVTKDGPVYVWVAANSGAHVQGGFEQAASGGNTAAIANARYTGPCDASGITEIQVFPA